ncbi:MAG: UbiA family prenyltransferase [Verrucomicrobiota bacterium]
MIFARRNNYWRTLLVLGRASNIPTVWSNCLAGWILGGGENHLKLVGLCLGASFLYLGGMFLNDAFDAGFDRQYRRQRPIPSGAISAREVWFFGFALLGTGGVVLFSMGKVTALLTVFLVVSILIYDAVHKMISVSPLVMAACRFLLYLAAASTARHGVSGLTVWSAVALAAYIVGLSFLARKESVRGPLQYWPCLFLGVPLALALLVNDSSRQVLVSTIWFLLAAWILWALRQTFWSPQRNVGITVSFLLAGIPLVDWLAVGGKDFTTSALFLIFFLSSLLFQRFIPAT